MKTKELLKKLEGIQTLESVQDILNVDSKKSVYYLYRLRKEGYVKTKKLSNNKRIYNISFENRFKVTDYIEIINKNSHVKLKISETYNIYGKEPSLEETLVYAVKTRSLRTILAALSLFKKINNWSKLYYLTKQNYIERQVGALYDLSRKLMRTRKMTKRFRNNALPKKDYSFIYMIPKLKSRDFREIEERWKVYLPFNIKDLEAYQ